MLARYPDWQARLGDFLAASRCRKFQYGAHDCCLFAADCVLAMTGEDIAREFRGKYRNRKQALQMAKSYCGSGSVRSLILEALAPLPSILPAFAQRGDVILMQRKRDYSLGIVALNGKEILKAAGTGVVSLPLSTAVRAWRV